MVGCAKQNAESADFLPEGGVGGLDRPRDPGGIMDPIGAAQAKQVTPDPGCVKQVFPQLVQYQWPLAPVDEGPRLLFLLTWDEQDRGGSIRTYVVPAES
jgi:hypothetical protein